LEIIFGQGNWGVIVLISVLTASAATAIVYLKNSVNQELMVSQRSVLMSLRFLSVFLIALLLTNPFIKTLKKINQPPQLILAVDNSQSMAGIDGAEEKKEHARHVISEIVGGLSDRFEVITYSFGEKTRQNQNPDFSEKTSDYGEMIRTIYDQHFNENTGALIIVGDGIYNKGENPANFVKRYQFPVYTIGTGDTASVRDAIISGIRVNHTAFKGNKFPVEADLQVSGFSGRNIRFNMTTNGEQVFSRNILISEDEYFTTISMFLDATTAGIQYYTATFELPEGEKNKANNTWTFAINVLENKQKILILSNGPHPDAGALKYALEKQINYEVDLITSEPYPEEIKDVNLIILNQFPSSEKSGSHFFKQSAEKRIPLLLIIGNKTYLPQLGTLLPGIEIIPEAGNAEEAQLSVNELFTSFAIGNELKSRISGYPPIMVPFARYTLDPTLQVIAFQRIKNVTTAWPAIAAGILNGRKMGIIFGEGLWRWRMHNYASGKSHAEFNELVDKLVQYLAIRDNSDHFNIYFNPVFDETENVTFTAEVYNDSYELVNSSDVSMAVTDSTGKEFRYVFDKTGSFYRLDGGIFPPGEYHFTAVTSVGESEYTETGDFTVMPVNAEKLETKANHRLLNLLSWETNGQFFLPDQTDLLVDTILGNRSIKPVKYFQTFMDEIVSLKWFFFVLILVLSSEWFLRKYWGIY